MASGGIFRDIWGKALGSLCFNIGIEIALISRSYFGH